MPTLGPTWVAVTSDAFPPRMGFSSFVSIPLSFVPPRRRTPGETVFGAPRAVWLNAEANMKRNQVYRRFSKLAGCLGLAAGFVFQTPGCTLNQITATTVLDGQQAILQVLRGLVLSPIDALLTQAVYTVFPEDD